MERDAVRPLVDGVRDLARSRQPGVEDERRDQAGLVTIERSEPDLLSDALRDEARAPVAERRPWRGVVEAVVADDQQAAIARRPGELGDDLEADLVGPLEVLEHEDGRSVQQLVDRRHDVDDEHPPTTSPGRGHDLADRQELAPERAEFRLTEGVAGHVLERRGGHVDVLGRDVPAGHAEPPRHRVLPDRADQARLADPGLAGDQEHLAASVGRFLQASVGKVEQLVTTDEERADERADVDHRRRSVGRVRLASSVIRPMTPHAHEPTLPSIRDRSGPTT